MKIQEIRDILDKITFAPTNLNMGWEWDVEICKIYNEKGVLIEKGYSIRTTFMRPDANTGEIEKGYGRWMYVPDNISTDGLVKTAWVCADLIIKHELMEAFLYEQKRIFDPHKSISDLQHNTRTVTVSDVEIEPPTNIDIDVNMNTNDVDTNNSNIIHTQNIDIHMQEIRDFLNSSFKKKSTPIESKIDIYDNVTEKIYHDPIKHTLFLTNQSDKLIDGLKDDTYTLSDLKVLLKDVIVKLKSTDPAEINALILSSGFTDINPLEENFILYKNPSKKHRSIIHLDGRIISLINDVGVALQSFENEDYTIENVKTILR